MPNFQTSDGLTLHYKDDGDGVPVLCLSGLTRNSEDFAYMLPHMAGARVIRLDYRGRGRSDWAEDHLSYNVPREGQDALELLDHLGIGKAGFVGTSRGGLITMILAMTARERMLGAVLNDIGPELDLAGLEVIMGYLGKNPIWTTLAEATRARPGVMTGFANVPEARWRAEVEKFYHQVPGGLVINYDPRLRDAVLEAGEKGAPDLWPFYEALKGLPVAVIRGANSDLLSAQTLAEMASRNPDAIIAEVPDRGHVPFLDEPEAVAALKTWLGRIA